MNIGKGDIDYLNFSGHGHSLGREAKAKNNDICGLGHFTSFIKTRYQHDHIGLLLQMDLQAFINANKCKKKLWFIHALTTHDTSKTAKITKR